MTLTSRLTPSPGHKNEPPVRFDAQLAGLAGTHHLVFGLDELRELGLGARAVQKRVSAGRLHRIHQAVYALVPPASLTVLGRYRAAVLACGPRAALSHRSAADLLDLRACHRRVVEVLVPGRSTRRHPGIQVHRGNHFDPSADRIVVEGVPVTTRDRTHLDLAAVVPGREVERALSRDEITRTFDLLPIQEQLSRNPAHPGNARLAWALASLACDGPTLTDSELEERAFALCDRSGIARPRLHHPVDPGDDGVLLRPDLVWPEVRLVVEIDGGRFHRTRHAFEQDRRRDQRLVAAGWRVIRITHAQLRDDAAGVSALLARLLAA